MPHKHAVASRRARRLHVLQRASRNCSRAIASALSWGLSLRVRFCGTWCPSARVRYVCASASCQHAGCGHAP
eukprot:15407067-Alexandrium_andersonii.AAC.1